MKLVELLKKAVEQLASDIHLIDGAKVAFRIDGEIVFSDFLEQLRADDINTLCYSILSHNQKVEFELKREIDFSFEVENLGIFRANYYFQKNSIAASFRVLPTRIPSLDELSAPSAIYEIIKRLKGLVLVTGATGSGKSTTLASMLNEIIKTEKKHIITIEEPIEYIFKHASSIISQRAVGDDTKSFSTALKFALREDPDIIMVGEIRDTETMKMVLEAAQTGHLVFATLHTNSAVSTLNRIVSMFPSQEQNIARAGLAASLNAVISQLLLPKISGGRICAYEILINTQAVSSLIRDEKIAQIYSQMEINQANSGMQTMEQAVDTLKKSKLISFDYRL